MSPSNRRNFKKRELIPGEFNQGITDVDAVEYTRARTEAFGFSVNVSRAFMAIEDGLIPVRRKILWYLYHDRKSKPDGGYVKVPEVVNPTTKYYAHGQQSLDNTFENMIQWWDTNAELLDIHGNQGSMNEPHSAAAPRYLECRMTKYAWKCFFEEFDAAITEMTRNYIDTDDEPLWLPSKYPNFLLSAATGVAWGNAAKHIPFNLIESFELTKQMIKNPDLHDVYLFPDSPRGYEVIDDGTALAVCKAGRGPFITRSPIQVEVDEKRKAATLWVTGWPEGVFMDNVLKEIRELVKSRKLIGIEDCADYTDKRSVVMAIHLRQNANPQYVIQELYKKTSLQTKSYINYNFTTRVSQVTLGLEDALRYWIETRIDTKLRYFLRQLYDIQKRESQLEALLAIQDEREFRKINDIIMRSTDIDEAITKITEATSLNSFQADVISNLTLKQRTINSRTALEKEMSEIPKKIAYIEEHSRSKDKLKEVICDELDEGIELFGKPRNCKIIRSTSIKEYEVTYRIVVTKKYIKKMATTGKNLIGNIDKNDDLIAVFSNVKDSDKLVFIASNGKVYSTQVSAVQGCDAVHKGISLIDGIGMPGDCITVMKFDKDEVKSGNTVDVELMLFTKNGMIKSSPVSQYIRCKVGSTGILLNEDDEVAFGTFYDGIKDAGKMMTLYTAKGYAVAWDLSQVAVNLDKNTKGTRYLTFEEGDSLIGITDISDKVIIMTKKGYGKICLFDDMFTSSKKKPKLQRVTRLGEGDELLKIIPLKKEITNKKLNVYLGSGKKIEIPISDIKQATRIARGEKLVKLPNGEFIVKIRIGD